MDKNFDFCSFLHQKKKGNAENLKSFLLLQELGF